MLHFPRAKRVVALLGSLLVLVISISPQAAIGNLRDGIDFLGYVPYGWFTAELLSGYAHIIAAPPIVALLMWGFWPSRKPRPQPSVRTPAAHPSGRAHLTVSRIDIARYPDKNSFLIHFQNKGVLTALSPSFSTRATRFPGRITESEVRRHLANLQDETYQREVHEERHADVDAWDEGDIGEGPEVPLAGWAPVIAGEAVLYLFIVFVYRDATIPDDTYNVLHHCRLYQAPLHMDEVVVNRTFRWVLGQPTGSDYF